MNNKNRQVETRRVARGIRRRVLAHTVANNGGYLSQACSSAETLAGRPYLMREYGLDAVVLVKQVETLLGANFGITEDDLAAVRLEAVHSEAKAEAL